MATTVMVNPEPHQSTYLPAFRDCFIKCGIVPYLQRCLRAQQASMALPANSGAEDLSLPSAGPLKQTAEFGRNLQGRLAQLPSLIKKYGVVENSSKRTLDRRNIPNNTHTTRSETPHEIIAKQWRNKEGKPKLLGNVDWQNLESWKTIHPENWSNDEVMNWIYNIAEETDQIDVDILYGESFSKVTGKDLSRMNRQDFVKLDSKHGPLLHDLFNIINADFSHPDDCRLSETIPFIKELFLPGDGKDVSDLSLGMGPDSPEPPDSPASGADSSAVPPGDESPVPREHQLASLSIYGQDYPFDPDDEFRDWMEEKVEFPETFDDEDTSNKATCGESMLSLGSLPCPPDSSGRLSSSSGGETDDYSVISGTTFSGSSGEYRAHYPQQAAAHYGEAGAQHQTPCGTGSGNFEDLGQQHLQQQQQQQQQQQEEDTNAQRIDFGPCMQQQQQHALQPQSMQEHLLHNQPHETVAFLKERGYHQDPHTGLFYTHNPDGSRLVKIPGLNEPGTGSLDFANKPQRHPDDAGHCSTTSPQRSGHEQNQPFGQPPSEKTVKRPRKTYAKRNNGATKNTAKPRQRRKSSSGSTTNNPTSTEGPKKRGRKKGQLSKDNHLWRFLLGLLKDNSHNPEHIRWENQSLGIFTIVNSGQVAHMWGEKKKNAKMNYEKMSRAIRFCKNPGYIKDAPKDGSYPKKLCYAFGDNTSGWQDLP